MITVNLAIIKMIAEWIIPVAGAAAVIVAVVKKMLAPVLKPLDEIVQKQAELEKEQLQIEECLTRDKKRLDKLDGIMDLIVKDNAMELTTLQQIINHMRTNNNTERMQKIEDDIDKYMATRK